MTKGKFGTLPINRCDSQKESSIAVNLEKVDRSKFSKIHQTKECAFKEDTNKHHVQLKLGVFSLIFSTRD